ncbi:hypothetical protein [Baekduia alba]|uniref:hypothetical protein n=1 Tax=Baekduia alba TaxID=2997333 RepID=UPI002340B17D|nr:hypothetical protein [Baekduia alba]
MSKIGTSAALITLIRADLGLPPLLFCVDAALSSVPLLPQAAIDPHRHPAATTPMTGAAQRLNPLDKFISSSATVLIARGIERRNACSNHGRVPALGAAADHPWPAARVTLHRGLV